MSDRTFLDTNVLTYVFDDAEPAKQAQAHARLEHEQQTRELALSTQVLQELYVSLTKGHAPIASPEVAERAVREASSYIVAQVDVQLVLAAIQTGRRHQLSFWDALIVCAAVELGCDRILTEDMSHGQVVEGVELVNPFA